MTQNVKMVLKYLVSGGFSYKHESMKYNTIKILLNTICVYIYILFIQYILHLNRHMYIWTYTFKKKGIIPLQEPLIN